MGRARLVGDDVADCQGLTRAGIECDLLITLDEQAVAERRAVGAPIEPCASDDRPAGDAAPGKTQATALLDEDRTARTETATAAAAKAFEAVAAAAAETAVPAID